MAGNEIQITNTIQKVSNKEALDLIRLHQSSLFGGNLIFKNDKAQIILISITH